MSFVMEKKWPVAVGDADSTDITIKNNQWEKRSGEYRIVTTVVVNVLLPENYDGFVIGVRNSDVNYYESDYLYQYYDADNFVMHRMGVGQ